MCSWRFYNRLKLLALATSASSLSPEYRAATLAFVDENVNVPEVKPVHHQHAPQDERIHEPLRDRPIIAGLWRTASFATNARSSMGHTASTLAEKGFCP